MAVYGKDLSDWMKVIVILGLAFMAYQHLVDRVDSTAQSEIQLMRQTTRIEHYLSAKDPNYWIEARRMESDPPASADPAASGDPQAPSQ